MAELQTIVAAATPQGKSALAVLRVSGSDAFKIFARCIKEKRLFQKTPPRYVQLYIAKDPTNQKTIDQITAIKYSSPRSFTGEDMVEIICHGSKIIVKEINYAIINAGARPAIGGEFTRRALLNGKINLMKAEAIRGLIESDNEAELLCAQKLYSGSANKFLENWKDKIIEQLSKIEAQIEFEETDNISSFALEGKKKIEYFLLQIKQDLKKREKIRAIKNGLKVVIAGPVNAGKSTLFNKLVGYKRAIVHSEPGTTRDTISERLIIKNNEIQLIDSAGIRKAEHEIEQEGIARSRTAIKKSNVIIWMTAADEIFGEDEIQELVSIRGKNLICVINKIDKNSGKEKVIKLNKEAIDTIRISLKENKNIDQLVSEIEKKVGDLKQKIAVPDFLLNTRHEKIGKLIYKEISLARKDWERPEIVSYHFKKAISFMDEYLGKTHSEEIINKIFNDFCIGK
ncbi:MAG: tRNA uridine-5-carboxymethylaminomethyl(34) synthesis GTPase MnmE [Chitinispirillaceae bacterium]|jgi:tRNA modification GTPase